MVSFRPSRLAVLTINASSSSEKHGPTSMRALLRLAVAADLDEVHTVLDLLANLARHLVGGAAEHAFRGRRHAEPPREVIGEPAVGDEVAAGGKHARAGKHSVGDRIAHRDRRVPGAAAIAHAGDAGLEHLARVPHRAHGAPFRAAIDVDFLRRARFAVGDMAVGIDQAGHDRGAYCVEYRECRLGGLRPRAARPHRGNPAIDDAQRRARQRRLSVARDQRSAAYL